MTRIDLLNKVANKEITPRQADIILSNLIIEKLSILSNNIENGNSRWIHKYDDAPSESRHEMEGYQWALNDVNEMILK